MLRTAEKSDSRSNFKNKFVIHDSQTDKSSQEYISHELRIN